MPMTRLRHAVAVISCLAACAASPSRPDIYDESTDGNKQVAEALEVASKENKRVLLQFGANWCGWCHKLHALCASDPDIARRLNSSYVVVLVDVNGEHNKDVNERYGNPRQHGLPVLVVLDADGHQLVTQETGALEKGSEHDPVKVLAFLEKWAPAK
jgi:thiol:disulfide interchange protein